MVLPGELKKAVMRILLERRIALQCARAEAEKLRGSLLRLAWQRHRPRRKRSKRRIRVSCFRLRSPATEETKLLGNHLNLSAPMILLIGPVTGGKAALDADMRALAQGRGHELGDLGPGDDAMPLRLLLPLAGVVLVGLLCCQGEVHQSHSTRCLFLVGILSEVAL